VRIVTNPGSNLDEDLAQRLDVDVLPQKIVVDGISHDTRNTIDFAQVDAWVQRAQKHPHVQGTSEVDFVEAFERLIRKDPDVLCIMTSRKIIGSYDAALAATRTLRSHANPTLSSARVEVVDTMVTDVGAGLITLAAVQARKEGLDPVRSAIALRRMAERGHCIMGVATLDNLIRGGRASFLQGWVANFFNVRPLLAFIDGSVTSVGRVSSKSDLPEKMDEYLATRLEKGARVWVGIAHGNVPEKAERFLAKLRERYVVEFALMRPLSASIYLHAGPGSVLSFVYPLAGLPLKLVPPSA
jgi:DegV family protein with EDD domain